MSDSIDPLPESDLKDALKFIYLGQATGLILPQILFQGGVLSLLILEIGGSLVDIGLAFTLVHAAAVMRVFAAPFVDVGDKKRILRGFLLAAAVSVSFIFVVFPAATRYGVETALVILWVVVFIYGGLQSLGAAAWVPLLSEIMPTDMRGRLFAKMRVIWRLSTLMATFLAGWVLGADPKGPQFVLVLSVGILFHFARVVCINQIPDMPPTRHGAREPLWRNLLLPLRNAQFRFFLLFTLVNMLLGQMALPFVTPFLKNHLCFPSSMTVYSSTLLSVGAVISLLGWGWLSDSCGNRIVFLISIVLVSLALIIFSLVPSFHAESGAPFLVASTAYAFLGIGNAGIGIAMVSRLISESPRKRKASFMAVWFLMWSLAMSGGPSIGGIWLHYFSGASITILGIALDNYRVFFLLIAGLNLLSVVMLRLLKPIDEPRIRETLSSIVYTVPSRLGAHVLGWMNRGNGNSDESDT